MAATSRRAFSLIELLVVISIIAVLVALLLPSLKSARDAGRLVQCASNQRQLAFADLNYANENAGWFPGNGGAGLAQIRIDLAREQPTTAAGLSVTLSYYPNLKRYMVCPDYFPVTENYPQYKPGYFDRNLGFEIGYRNYCGYDTGRFTANASYIWWGNYVLQGTVPYSSASDYSVPIPNERWAGRTVSDEHNPNNPKNVVMKQPSQQPLVIEARKENKDQNWVLYASYVFFATPHYDRNIANITFLDGHVVSANQDPGQFPQRTAVGYWQGWMRW